MRLLLRIARVLFRFLRIAVWLLILGAIAALAYVRLFGIPQPLQKRLVDEIAKKGVPVQFGRIHFDPFQGFIATDAVIFNPNELQQRLVSVNEIGLKLNYQRLLKKQQSLEELRIENATLSVPLDLKKPQESMVTGKEVSAVLRLEDGGVMRVDNVRGEFNGVRVALAGSVHFRAGSRVIHPGAQPSLFARIFKELENVQFDEKPEISGQFHVDLAKPELSTARAQVKCKGFTHEKIKAESFEARMVIQDRLLKVQEFEVRLYDGKITVTGEYDLATGVAKLDVHSDTNPKLLLARWSKNQFAFFRDYEFSSNPVLKGKFEGRPQELGLAVASGAMEATQFKFRRIPILSFRSKFTLRDGIFRMTNFEGVRPEGTFHGTYTCRLKSEDFTIDLVSTVQPAPVRSVFPAGMAEWLTRFRFDAPPEVVILWHGNWKKPDAVDIRGHVRAGSFRLDEVPMDSLDLDVGLQGPILSITNFVLTRKEGDVTGHCRYDGRMRQLEGSANSTANPYDIAKTLGSNAVAAIAPYQFIQPPKVTLNGMLDFSDPTQNRIDARVQGKHFYCWRVNAESVESDLSIRDRNVKLNNVLATVYGGQMFGDAEFEMRAEGTHYRIDTRVDRTDLQQLAESITRSKPKYKGQLSGVISASGIAGDIRSMEGKGEAVIENGVLWELPVFGELLSSVLNTILPGKIATSTATEARGDFVIHQGVAEFSRLTIDAGMTSMIAMGRYKLWSGGLDFEVEVRPWNASLIAKPLQLVLLPFMKLFTLHLGGTWQKPEWRTVYLPKELFDPLGIGSQNDNPPSPIIPSPSGSKIQ